MRTTRLALCAMASLCLVFPQDVLTNAAILKLVQSGAAEEAIVAKINSEPGQYSTNFKDLKALYKEGVSDRIVAALVTRADAEAASPVPRTPRVFVADSEAQPFLLLKALGKRCPLVLIAINGSKADYTLQAGGKLHQLALFDANGVRIYTASAANLDDAMRGVCETITGVKPHK